VRGHLSRRESKKLRYLQATEKFNKGELEINEEAYNYPRVNVMKQLLIGIRSY